MQSALQLSGIGCAPGNHAGVRFRLPGAVAVALAVHEGHGIPLTLENVQIVGVMATD